MSLLISPFATSKVASLDAVLTLLTTTAEGAWVHLGPSPTLQPNSFNDVQAARTKAVFDVGGASGTTFASDSAVLTVCKNTAAGFDAWNGSALGTGAYKHFLWFAGIGHVDGAGNQVFRINLNDAAASILAAGDGGVWAAITDQNPYGLTQSPDYPTETGGQSYFMYPTQAGQNVLQPVGSLGYVSTHTWDQFVFDEVNQCLWVACAAIFNNSGNAGLFKLDLVTNTWSIQETSLPLGMGNQGATRVPPAATGQAGTYIVSQVANFDCYRYNPATKVNTKAATYSAGNTGQMAKDIIPSVTGVAGAWDLVAWNGTSGVPEIFPDVFGATPQNNYGFGAAAGAAQAWTQTGSARYRTVDGKMYMLIDGNGQIQTVQFAADKSVYTIANITVTNAPLAPTTNGVLGKWQYHPDYDCFFALVGSNGQVWMWKPYGWSPP